MQQQSHDHGQKSMEDEVTRPRSHSERESTLSVNQQPSTKSISHPEIKRCDALCPVLFERRDSILEIRSSEELLQPSSNEDNQSTLITINVSGNHFQTYLSTLECYPETLLGDENKRKQYWNSDTQEYFFDRHRACFESILYYYQSNGRLRRPDFVPLDTFLEEITFFQLGSQASAQIHQTENVTVIKQIAMPRILWRRYIWFYFEFPQHSSFARFINLLSMLFTIISCLSLAIETLPVYNNHWNNICKKEANISLESSFTPRCSALFISPFFIIQTICVTYFVIEFVLRLISTPSYLQFCLSFFNWVDLGAIIPYFIILAIELSDRQIDLNTNAVMGIRLLRVLRFTRIFKIYLVFRKLKALRVLISTVKESLVDFAVMITILTLIAFLFGAATYFAEQDSNGDVFDSIPKATYWGIITITGVGYGDIYPITAIGRIITCLCAFVGAGMMGMLVSVLVDRYQRVYNRKMYVPEHEISSAELDRLRNSQDNTGTNVSSSKSNRIQLLSSAVSRRLSSVHRRLKPDQRRSSSQAHRIQSAASFDGSHIDNNEVNGIVTTMKEKMSETGSDTGTNINLKMIDTKNYRLWTTYTSGSSRASTSNHENIKPSKSQTF